MLRAGLLGLAVAAAVAAGWWLDLGGTAGVDRVRVLVDRWGVFGPVAYAALVAAATFAQVPLLGSLAIAAGAVVLGGWLASFYGWIGAMVATAATFVVARAIARERVQRALAGRLGRLRTLDDRLARHGFWTVVALRVAGGLSPVLNWGLGLTGVGFGPYMAGTALGIIPGVIVTVVFAEALAGPADGSRLPASPGMLVMVGALVVVALVGAMMAVRRRDRYEARPLGPGISSSRSSRSL